MPFDLVARHVSPGTRLGEVLFGLIMTLTFTLGAGMLVGTAEGASTSLLVAAIGCNVAWGIIDAALLLLGVVFDRSRLARLGNAIAGGHGGQDALTLVANELDETLVPITSEEQRSALYRHVVERVRSAPRQPVRLTRSDWYAAISVFCLVFIASVPAAAPFALIDDPWIALRVSNALLIGLLFWVGYKWARYTIFNPWLAGSALMGVGVLLVLIAIPLGG